MENNNPFEKQIRKMQEDAALKTEKNTNVLGVNSNIPDTSEEDYNKIKEVIPQATENNLEEGFQKMLNILEKNSPKMPNDTPKSASIKKEKTSKVVALEKAPSNKAKPVEEKKKEKMKKTSEEDTSIQNKSEELGLHYTDEEILPLIDSLLTKGYASETTTLRGYNITFRTSYLWEDQEVVTRTDNKISDLTLNASGTFFYDTYALAANLEQFGANYFKPINKGTPAELKESFDERVEFLEGLSSPFINILMRKKLDFLKKVQFLLDNYDRLLQAF